MSIGSSYFVFVLNGLAPLIFTLSSSSSKVYSFGMRIKGPYQNDGMTISI
jgi:hypothetical protein